MVPPHGGETGELCMLEGERLELLWLIGPSHNIQVARELGAVWS
jgi:hypothetical protein